MTLAELISQWRKHANAAGLPGNEYDAGFATGLSEAAGELEDWARHHAGEIISLLPRQPGQPVDPKLFNRTAPRWNCVDYPGEGLHYWSLTGDCRWCGMTEEQILAEDQASRGRGELSVTDMTLQGRLDRHPGLKLEKEYLGTGPSPDEPNWESHQWRVTIRYLSRDDDGTLFSHPHDPVLVVPYEEGVANAQDGSGVTLASVLSMVLDAWSVHADCSTFEEYCEEFGINPDSLSEFRKWEEAREFALGDVAGFFRDVRERGGDDPHDWLYETEHTDD